MGSRAAAGPLTEYIAQELRAQRGRLQLTFDEVAAKAGISRSAAVGALRGTQAIAIEVFGALCKALELDPVKLIDDADRATRSPDSRNENERPQTLQEIKQQRLQAQAQPMAGAADDRPMMEQDDDWEPR